jgi:hypothetical protein
MYDSSSGSGPVFQHWKTMSRRDASSRRPGITNPASGEVLATYVIGRMMHRVLVELERGEGGCRGAQKARKSTRHQSV